MINLAKFSCVPSQVMTHLGVLTDTLSRVVRVTADKIQEITHIAQHLQAIGFALAQHMLWVVVSWQTALLGLVETDITALSYLK